jgi:hypothetical protein
LESSRRIRDVVELADESLRTMPKKSVDILDLASGGESGRRVSEHRLIEYFDIYGGILRVFHKMPMPGIFKRFTEFYVHNGNFAHRNRDNSRQFLKLLHIVISFPLFRYFHG